jgi:hypothetical protein
LLSWVRMVGSTLVFASVQDFSPAAKSNAERLTPRRRPSLSPGAAKTVFNGRELYYRITLPVSPSSRTRFFSVEVGPANLPAISKSPVSPYCLMSRTSAPRAPEVRRD